MAVHQNEPGSQLVTELAFAPKFSWDGKQLPCFSSAAVPLDSIRSNGERRTFTRIQATHKDLGHTVGRVLVSLAWAMTQSGVTSDINQF
jgi:hypothetical protein